MKTFRPFRLKFLVMVGPLCLALALACATSSGTHTLPPSTGLVSLCMTGTSAEDWTEIDVKLLQVTLTPQGGGAPVVLLAPQGGALPLNLALLGRSTQFLGTFAAPVGTYVSASVTLSRASRDVALASSWIPSAGFPGAGTVDSFDIQVAGDASAPTLTLAVPLAVPLVASTDASAVLDLEWDTNRPGFLTGAALPKSTGVSWTVAFDHCLRQRVITDASTLALRPMTGTATKFGSDRTSFQLSPYFDAGLFTRYFLPQTIGVKVDPAGGAVFFDVDGGTVQVIKDLSTIGDALPGRAVSVGGRIQPDGSLLASRIWAGKGMTVGTLMSGHVAQVNSANSLVRFDGDFDSGYGVGDGGYVTDATVFTGPAILGTGTAFLAAGNLGRGFMALPMVHFPAHGDPTLLSVDIVSPDFKGSVTAADGTGVSLACPSGVPGSTLNPTLPYIAAGTANGNDNAGLPLQGFCWWVAGAPDRIRSGAGAAASFAQAAGAAVDFGGSLGVVRAVATTHAVWGNASNPGGWSAQWAVLEPLPLPIGSVAAAWVPSGGGGTFGMTVPDGANEVTVDVDASTWIYQATVPGPNWIAGNPFPVLTAVDPSTAAGQATLVSALGKGAVVRVFGIPQGNGHLLAGTVFYYTYRPY